MIIKREHYATVEFGELAPGDVFIEKVDGDDYIQMKINPIQEEDGTTHNAVGLDYGDVYYVHPTKKVQRVVAELTIK